MSSLLMNVEGIRGRGGRVSCIDGQGSGGEEGAWRWGGIPCFGEGMQQSSAERTHSHTVIDLKRRQLGVSEPKHTHARARQMSDLDRRRSLQTARWALAACAIIVHTLDA
jgi:hypothetical protein